MGTFIHTVGDRTFRLGMSDGELRELEVRIVDFLNRGESQAIRGFADSGNDVTFWINPMSAIAFEYNGLDGSESV